MDIYNFDASCEFTGTTKEEVIERIKAAKANETTVSVGKYTCRVNPLRVKTYKKTTGHDYEEILEMLIDEFANGGDETNALKRLFELYGDTFDETNTKRISKVVNYAMAAIEDDWFAVKTGKYPKANSFKEMLLRDNEDPYIKLTTGESIQRKHGVQSHP